jgi:hypothetical protein
MGNQDQFDQMMRKMGVKPIADGGTPTVRRRRAGASASEPITPAKANPELEALQEQVASLEAALAKAEAVHLEAAGILNAQIATLTAAQQNVQSDLEAARLQQQVLRLCDDCPRVSGVMMIKVEARDCDACGGADLYKAVRQFLDACLVNGRLRVLVVGRDNSAHALLRSVVHDSRVKLTQFPVSGGAKKGARVSVDATGQDVVVMWGPSAQGVVRGEILRQASLGPVPVALMLNAAAKEIATHSDDD